ncbi:BMA-JBTS-14 [Dirofilaria immitis]|nr:BMA-JBTS-14 [Dirofilaria immitis]
MLDNHHDKQDDSRDNIALKHLKGHYGRASSAEANSKSSNEQIGKNVTMAAILSQPVYDVFVQHDKSFRRTDRKQYEKMLEARTDDLVSIAPSESIQSALTVQVAFHNVSLIIQGFLSGFGIFHAIFAFALVDIVNFTSLFCFYFMLALGFDFLRSCPQDILQKNYAWLAMSIQATFYACFAISTIAALDRLEISSSLMDNLKRGLSLQGGSLETLLCLIGTMATLLSSLYDEWLAEPMKQQKNQYVMVIDPLVAWRLLSGARATAGLLSWFLLTFSPNTNTLLKQIRNPESVHENCNVS